MWGSMKILLGTIITLFLSILALFLYQNQSRSISMDTHGNLLSLDIQFVGFVITKDLSVSLLIFLSLILGMIIGLLMPMIARIFMQSEEE